MKNNLSQYTASSTPLLLLRMIPLIKRSARSLHITWFDFSALSRQVVWKSSSTPGFAPFVSNNMAASWNPTENNKTILKFNKPYSSFTLHNTDIKTDTLPITDITDIDKICTERNGYLHQSLYLSSIGLCLDVCHCKHTMNREAWFFTLIVLRLRV